MQEKHCPTKTWRRHTRPSPRRPSEVQRTQRIILQLSYIRGSHISWHTVGKFHVSVPRLFGVEPRSYDRHCSNYITLSRTSSGVVNNYLDLLNDCTPSAYPRKTSSYHLVLNLTLFPSLLLHLLHRSRFPFFFCPSSVSQIPQPAPTPSLTLPFSHVPCVRFCFTPTAVHFLSTSLQLLFGPPRFLCTISYVL